MRTLTSLAAREEPAGPAMSSAIACPPLDPSVPLVPVAEVVPCGDEPPEIIDRDVVATRHDSRAFGSQLAARAWSLGLFAAKRKAFVGDGSSWIWTEWERHFKAFEFVPVLDFIHALTRVYAAALAGRSPTAGWEIYRRWITWTWQGEVAKVIAELAARQQELGLPTLPNHDTDDGDTSPRRIVRETLTYLHNQQSRMNDPAYRACPTPRLTWNQP